MNKIRRKALDNIYSLIQQIIENLEDIKSQEEDCLDNMPESLRDSKNACAAETAIASMEDALDNLYNAAENIEEAKE